MSARAWPSTILRLPSWLGDFVASEPLVRATWEEWRSTGASGCLSLLARPRFLALLEGRFEGAQRIELVGRELPAHYRGHRRALFLNGALASVLAAWRAGVAQRIGWASGARSPFLTYALERAGERGGRAIGWGPRPPLRRVLPRPFVLDCLELGLQAGITARAIEPVLAVREEARVRVAERLRGAGRRPPRALLALHVGCRPGSAKGVPASLWCALIEALDLREDELCVLLGGPGEEEVVAAVAGAAPSARVLVVLEPAADLAELAAWAERARLFVCADGGARHVAKAVGARTLVLHGPTDPRHTAMQLAREEGLAPSLACAPCHQERCPLVGEEQHRCMRSHDPRELARRVLAHLRPR